MEEKDSISYGDTIAAISHSLKDYTNESVELDRILNTYKELLNQMDKVEGNRNAPKEKRKITITNPEKLNGRVHRDGIEWEITYVGRDLSIKEDNYKWEIKCQWNPLSGWYVIQRERGEGESIQAHWKTNSMPNRKSEWVSHKMISNPTEFVKLITSTMDIPF
jgi:hypothetical protein